MQRSWEQALAKVLTHCPLTERRSALLADVEAALAGRWLGCSLLPSLQLLCMRHVQLHAHLTSTLNSSSDFDTRGPQVLGAQ